MSATDKREERPRRAFFVRLTPDLAEYVNYLTRRQGCNAQQVIRAALLHLMDEDPDWPEV